jgi:hypothetical protein
MDSSSYIGIAVVSGDTSGLNASRFDNVVLER